MILAGLMTDLRDSHPCMLRPIDADADVLGTMLTIVPTYRSLEL